MEFAKFLFRFCNNTLPVYLNNYFESSKTIHQYNTCQISNKEFSTLMLERNVGGRKMVQCNGPNCMKKKFPLQ